MEGVVVGVLRLLKYDLFGEGHALVIVKTLGYVTGRLDLGQMISDVVLR